MAAVTVTGVGPHQAAKALGAMRAPIKALGLSLGPGAVLLAFLVAAFLVAMLLVLQLQLQARRIATVNELERELNDAQRANAVLVTRAAAASNLPAIESRALAIGMTAAGEVPGVAALDVVRVLPPSTPDWSNPPPPALPPWPERAWRVVSSWFHPAQSPSDLVD